MKNFLFLVALFFSLQIGAQTVYEENFENKALGLDLSTQGYELSLGSGYSGVVTAEVAENNGNRFARMKANPNGQANMRMVKTIDIAPGKVYKYEVESLGPFKRQLRVYSENDEQIASSDDYKPSTSTEETNWKKMEVSFYVPEGVTKIKLGFHHYWSGTIDLDNFKVHEDQSDRLSAYYVSSSLGDDNNSGTEDAPFKSLAKISSMLLFPGDSVLFNKGDTLNGHFVVNGSGTTENPILISSYGEGELPVLTGQVGENGGGDFEEAVLVLNNDNLIFDGLEIQNERTVSRNGVADTDAYGINVKNNGIKVMHNLFFRNMRFKNVFAVEPILNPEDFNSIQVSALNFSTSRNTEAGNEKNINGITVENCYFGNLQRFGIKFGHSGGSEGIGNDSINRNMNIHIHNNGFYYNGGTGVLPNSTYNCLIENNIFDHPGASTDPRMPGRGSSIWNFNCINTIMQYNTCLSTRGYLDSHGIHIDNNNTNTFVQYNYMEDCEGGFVEILRGNTNAVYRFNVSVNDGWRVNEGWKDSNHTIWVTSDRWNELVPTDGVYIYNNTCIINKPYTTSINMDGKNMFVYNNIWSSTNGAGMGAQNPIVRNQDTPFTMTNNLFEGTVDATVISWDANPVIANAKFNGEGENELAYQLQADSPAINKGKIIEAPVIPGAGYGVFKNIAPFPVVDFFGNAINLSAETPNIGACNAKNGELVAGNKAFPQKENNNNWRIFPNLLDSKIEFSHAGNLPKSLYLSLANLNGQILQTHEKKILPGEQTFFMELSAPVQNGIYLLTIRGKGVNHHRKIAMFR